MPNVNIVLMLSRKFPYSLFRRKTDVSCDLPPEHSLAKLSSDSRTCQSLLIGSSFPWREAEWRAWGQLCTENKAVCSGFTKVLWVKTWYCQQRLNTVSSGISRSKIKKSRLGIERLKKTFAQDSPKFSSSLHSCS